jgi:hypothetical protein
VIAREQLGMQQPIARQARKSGEAVPAIAIFSDVYTAGYDHLGKKLSQRRVVPVVREIAMICLLCQVHPWDSRRLLQTARA